jgi:hypothetical protein
MARQYPSFIQGVPTWWLANKNGFGKLSLALLATEATRFVELIVQDNKINPSERLMLTQATCAFMKNGLGDPVVSGSDLLVERLRELTKTYEPYTDV